VRKDKENRHSESQVKLGQGAPSHVSVVGPDLGSYLCNVIGLSCGHKRERDLQQQRSRMPLCQVLVYDGASCHFHPEGGAN
jgi:hypothetical protein